MLFVALLGEHVDGNDFIAAAVKNGAAAVLAGRSCSQNDLINDAGEIVPLLVCDDPVVLYRASPRWPGRRPARRSLLQSRFKWQNNGE